MVVHMRIKILLLNLHLQLSRRFTMASLCRRGRFTERSIVWLYCKSMEGC